ncbi:helix-turn-helix transcriptional regulator [Mesorhizobium sp. M9A.F.Ca.ET.002.03.1.2]|uniref:helix-turn-helix transcriptional regulator n=1 Tax=Mesorhizobium sp. M9A.F.Ca.ET.002.03.1.2 TaxID=2493668 RepID=UPI001FE152F1|nr:helix-turn-helix transcriptional regulator [Mesorhizobium sp. M9A.F.Ca.ET.002.03.1.2]
MDAVASPRKMPMLEMPRDEQAFAIVDRIYEAALAAELWPDALEAASALSRSASGAIFLVSDQLPVRAIGEAHLQPLLDEFMAGDNWTLSESVQRMCSMQPASFVRIDDFMTGEEIERDPIYACAKTFGVGLPVCTSISMPSGELALFVFQRWLRDGKYDQAAIDLLNGLRPHFARAGLVAARLGLERARTAVSILRDIGLPAAIMSGSGRVLTANLLLEDMADVLIPLAHGGMALADEQANALFQQAITQNQDNRIVRSIPVAAIEGRPALIVHVFPLRRAAHDFFSGADILVATTAVDIGANVPSPSILSGLFDLTPAEARLATELASGRSVQEAAMEIGVSIKSARTYLERIFRKTETSRQSQLVALLRSARTFP